MTAIAASSADMAPFSRSATLIAARISRGDEFGALKREGRSAAISGRRIIQLRLRHPEIVLLDKGPRRLEHLQSPECRSAD